MKKLAAVLLMLCVVFTACGQKAGKTDLPAQVQQCTVSLADNNRTTDRGETIIDFTMAFNCEDSENHKGTVYGEIYISTRQEDFEILDAKITSVPWTGHPWQFQGNALKNITHNGNRVMITVSGLFEKVNEEQASMVNEKLPGIFLKNFKSVFTKPTYERVVMCDYSHYIYRADILKAMAEGSSET